tara:strand:+ start:312 stop:530 length:219 start_codon:yes stop_codon:yes gene_type:complete
MRYIENNKRNLIMFLGLYISLLGVVFYDPLGFLFTGMGIVVIAIGLSSIFAGYFYLDKNEKVNKEVGRFEKK